MELLNFFKGKSYKLIDACKKGNNKKVQELLKNGVDVNSTIEVKKADNRKEIIFPLYVAVSQNNLELAKLLIENGANVNNTDEYGSTALHIVKDKDILQLLIQNGAEINILNKSDSTPLHESSYWNHLEIAKLLIDKGADINLRNSSGMTALEVAGENGNIEIGKFLLENGATVDIHIDGDIFTINKLTYDKNDSGLKRAILKLESLTVEKKQLLNKGTGNAIAEVLILSNIVEKLKNEILPSLNKIVNIAKIFFSDNNAIMQLEIPYFTSFHTIDSADKPEIAKQFSQILKQIQILKSN